MKNFNIEYSYWISTVIEAWRGSMQSKLYEEYHGCHLKTQTLYRLWLIGRIPTSLHNLQAEVETQLPIWKPKLAHETIASPPFFPNPDSYISVTFTISSHCDCSGNSNWLSQVPCSTTVIVTVNCLIENTCWNKSDKKHSEIKLNSWQIVEFEYLHLCYHQSKLFRKDTK